MDPSDATSVALTAAELHLLIEGLDAYEYWQLGDVLPHDAGLVFVPGDESADRFWTLGAKPSGAQREAIEGERACRALAARLREAGHPPD